MSTPIFRLPPELLDLILAEFCVHCQVPDEAPQAYRCGDQQKPDQPSWYSLNCDALFQVCLASRRLLGPAQAVLYHDFMHGYGDSWRTTQFTWDRRLTSFMRTISRRPDLASRVRRVHIDPKLLFFVQSPECDEALQLAASSLSVGPENISITAETEFKYGLRHRYTWNKLDFVGSDISWGLVYVLLLQLPQLRHLSYKISDLNRPVCIGLAPPSSFCSLSGPSLKTVSAACEGEYPRDEDSLFSEVMRRFSARDLETVNLHMADFYIHKYQVTKYPSTLWASVKSLHITKSRSDKASMSLLLSSIEGLESFTYEAALRQRPAIHITADTGIFPLQPHEAIDCLRKFAHSLRYLHLEFEVDKKQWIPSRYTEVSPVTDFVNLEHFRINVDAIYNGVDPVDPVFGDRRLLVNLLPRSLQSLEITGDTLSVDSRLVSGLHGLVDAIAGGQFPCFRRVTCDEVILKHEYDVHLIPRAFRALAVEFTLSTGPLSKSVRNRWEDFGPGGVVPEHRARLLGRTVSSTMACT